MALLPQPAPSSAGSSSHPSSPEPSLPDMDLPDADAPRHGGEHRAHHSASPASAPAALAPAHTHDTDAALASARSTPPQASPTDLARSRSTGRGGCWTCRVRRKKCDEERVDGDSCKTCRRLGIQCLGWGTRRPDWMRDKEKVAEYKANIKAQLTRAGLIRGQPRAVYATLTPAAGDRYAGGSGALAGPGPSTLRAARGGGGEGYYAQVQGYDAARFAQGMSALSGLDPLGSPDALALAASPFVLPGNPFASPLAYAHEMPALGALPPYQQYMPQQDVPPSITPTLRDSPFNEQPEQYIQYYFEHVRPVQFVLAGKELTQVLTMILTAEPDGPLEYAICALASLHSTRAAAAQQGLAAGQVENSERSVDRRFYNKAYTMLMARQASGRPYTERDAVAAVFLISYHNLAGGGTGWTALAEVAYEWLTQTGVHEEQNPKLALVNMSPVQKVAAKATMWIDVLASVVFRGTPRFLALYRRLFGAAGGGAGFWAAANNTHLDLRMDRLTGCPDEALLAIAEAAALAHWKAAEAHKGCLSVRELVRRADAIEHALLAAPARAYAEGSPTADAAPMLPSGLPAPAQEQAPAAPPRVDEFSRRTVAAIWREAAVLYLQTVVHGCHPGVPEIVKSTNALIDHIQVIPVSDLDRAMALPFVLTGVMSDDPLIRELVKQRLTYHRDDFFNGSMSQGRTFVEYVHARRQSAAARAGSNGGTGSHRAPDWRDLMRERWSAVTIV